ncbi:MAG: hypothetical protein L0I62_01945 [Gammaproteobacteria bacterium]|nr:hypothetical protein [Gammaproteobacteria bacterium]
MAKVAEIRRAKPGELRGQAPHRRTQSDYMATLLDRVTPEAWGEVIDATVATAKSGDAQARAWLASYLLGRPKAEAPSPLDVTAERISGEDALVAKLAHPAIDRFKYPMLHDDDEEAAAINARIAAELAERIPKAKA